MNGNQVSFKIKIKRSLVMPACFSMGPPESPVKAKKVSAAAERYLPEQAHQEQKLDDPV